VRLLLDTNVLIPLLDEQLRTLAAPMQHALRDSGAVLYASVATLWEIAIKTRLGRLTVRVPRALLAEAIERAGIHLIPIIRHHVLVDVEPEPATRDPFDRLLLAQCLVENLRLVTADRALVTHPLAWQP